MRCSWDPGPPWRHELTHCLHTTAGAVLQHRGLDPLEVLGAAWWFEYPGDLRREEYYLPGHAESLFGGLAPHHGLRSQWHRPTDAAAGWREVRAEVLAGAMVPVVVDNFYLPFRPAYQDVHTNHLLAVYGVDDEAEEVLVVDAVPPAYQGPLPLSDFLAARDSGNPVARDRDLFFTANPIENRWLSVEIPTDLPRLDLAFLREVVGANVRGFRRPADPESGGLSGLHRYLTGAAERWGDSRELVDEVFVVVGPALALAGLHASYLRTAGARLEEPILLQIGRLVDEVAHHWSALRIGVASESGPAPRAAQRLRRRAELLVDAHETVLQEMDRWLSGLSPTAQATVGPRR